jgi:hypothetical protein
LWDRGGATGKSRRSKAREVYDFSYTLEMLAPRRARSTGEAFRPGWPVALGHGQVGGFEAQARARKAIAQVRSGSSRLEASSSGGRRMRASAARRADRPKRYGCALVDRDWSRGRFGGASDAPALGVGRRRKAKAFRRRDLARTGLRGRVR